MSLVTKAIDKVENEQGKSAPIPMPANPRNKKKLWLMLGLVVLLLGVGAGYFFVIRSSSKTPTKPITSSATAKRKLTKPDHGARKDQGQLIASAKADITKAVGEKGGADSAKVLQSHIVENKATKETKETKATKGHKENKESKGIKKPKPTSEKKEAHYPVEDESFEDSPREAIPETKEKSESSIPSYGHKEENKLPKTESWVKEDSPKGPLASADEGPVEEIVPLPELESDRELVQKVLEAEDKSDSRAQTYYKKGVLYHRERKLNQAIDSYKKALSLNPGHQPARSNLAVVLMQVGRFEEAEKELILLHALRPKDPKILFNLGLLLYKLGQYSSAQAKLEQLLKVNPFHQEACLLLASICEEKGEMDQAEKLCRQAYRINSNNPMVFYRLARVLDLSGKRAEAAKFYQSFLSSSLEKDPELELAVRERLNYLLLEKEER